MIPPPSEISKQRALTIDIFLKQRKQRGITFLSDTLFATGRKGRISLFLSLSAKMPCLNAAVMHDLTKLFYPHQGKLLSVLEVITTP